MADLKYGRIFTEEDVKKILSAYDPSFPGSDAEMEFESFIAEVESELKFPAHEPTFLLRGQDKLAMQSIDEYRWSVDQEPTLQGTEFSSNVRAAQDRFLAFRDENPDRMKLPD